jgi:hypothetical protein
VREPSESAESIAEVLGALGVRWTIIGALAALEYRHDIRLTTDADFLVEWDDDLVPALERAGFSVEVVADPGEPPHVLFVHGRGVKADLMLPVVEYQRVALDRAGRYLTVEDVIVHKLLAWRPRDRDDIASILATDPVLDTAYIERWADEWEVGDRWNQALRGR